MNVRETEEYRALRATIRERGTARVWLFVIGLGIWAATVITVASLATLPVATLLPLLLLAGVFEGVFSLHTGVERIGRYLQVFYENDGDAQWEHAAMGFGKVSHSHSPDPLFAVPFLLATLCNFVPAILAGAVLLEWSVVGTIHALFLVRVLMARRQALRQRGLDLTAFEALKAASTRS